MSVRLISKKKIAFRNPAPTGEKDKLLTVEPYKFETLPDWVVNDPMYAWAKTDGTINVADDLAENKKDDSAEDKKPPKRIRRLQNSPERSAV